MTAAHLSIFDTRTTCLPFVLLALVAASPLTAAAADAAVRGPPTLPLPREEQAEHHAFLAPGVQFGARAQGLSIDLGFARIATIPVGPADTFRRTRLSWVAGGLRVVGVAHEWSPAAVHGLFYLSTAGSSGREWWPIGFEIAIGGGRGGSSSYGLLQLSYLLIAAPAFEAFAAYQAPFGDHVDRPEWLPRWLFGARFRFDVADVRRERVRVEPDAT